MNLLTYYFGVLGPEFLNQVPTLLTGPKPKGIKVETFRIDYLTRTPKVEELSLQPISLNQVPTLLGSPVAP